MSENIQQAAFSVEALQSGDRAEFARFVEAYSPQVYRLGLKILNDPQDAEDVLQETFLKAFKAMPGFEGRSSLSTWLYRIAVNEALMLLRKRRPEAISIDEDVQTEEGEMEPVQIVDWCCLPEQELLSAEGRRYLDTAIQDLPAILKVVFILRDIEGLSIKETAETLNLSETAVKTRLLRARLKLREQLSNYYRDRVVEDRRP
ncbi:MAG: sigma-70 family RNA polymerase sigma factor [Anaerolineaceae bacterium]|nr:sigma-70 family RNA polymerase sigma factor [Anaerolineaceae bacterium]